MINDYIDDLVDVLEASDIPYILITGQIAKNGKTAGARVAYNLSRWTAAKEGCSCREDIHQLMDATVFE